MPVTVPREKLLAGVTICLSVVALRLGEAETLLDAGYTTASAILLSFAVEELGKAAMLQHGYDSGAPQVTLKDFRNHEAKLQAGGQLIGATPEAEHRLASLYVDWAGKWTWNDTPLDRDEIRDRIRAVEGALDRTAFEWRGQQT
jgi:hypothetical protein